MKADLNGEAEAGGLCWNVRVSDSSKDGETVKFTIITKTVSIFLVSVTQCKRYFCKVVNKCKFQL